MLRRAHRLRLSISISILMAVLIPASLLATAARCQEAEQENSAGCESCLGLDWLRERGVDVAPAATVDFSYNTTGGDKQTEATRVLVDLSIGFDLEKLIGLRGGTFFADFYLARGDDGGRLTGDFQGYSNIDSPDRIQLAELWYEQWLLGNRLRVKLGKMDANSEFAFVENGGEFINSSMGFSPTIFVLPTYPEPATAVVGFVYPVDGLYAGFAVFDGSGVDGVPTGRRGPKTFFDDGSDTFLIGEMGGVWGGGLPGRVGVGAWWHSGDFFRFEGGKEKGTQGTFLTIDQALWVEEPGGDAEQGIWGFGQFGWADQEVSEARFHVGLGATWVGPIPNRDSDALGLGLTWVDLSNERAAGFNGNELTLELFYKLQCGDLLSLKPDLQYIHNPGGVKGGDDALVASIRIEIAI